MSQGRILYIDDDVALARLAGLTLGRAGYEVSHAASGEEGLRRLADERFDAVALDHHMPGADGLDVLKAIRELRDAPPVIYVTGSEASHIAVAALKAGAADYVWKDVQGHFRELLVEAVANAMTQEALRRAKDEADQAVREARDRAEMLLKEVNHRLANSLALVASFARLQAGTLSDPAAKAALEAMQARIHAIAGVHRRLYTSEKVETVALDQYLQGLAADIEEAMRSGGGSHRIVTRIEPLEINTDRAVSIGIVATELITNAYKYAYPDRTDGEIRLILETLDDGGRLTIEDDGVGMPADTAASRGTGLGSRILRSMTNTLGAFAYEPAEAGTRATLVFKLAY